MQPGSRGDTPAGIRLERVPGAGLPDLTALVAASLAEELRFVKRLQDDWLEGRTRFDGPGESLVLALEGDRVVGVCGLTLDPFARDPGIGRVRRLYVLPAWRGRGVGRALVNRVIQQAGTVFRRVHLRTERAGAFFAGLGFLPLEESEHATHGRDLA